MLLALEFEAAKGSSLKIIKKFGLLAKLEYFYTFVALPWLSRLNNCYTSHLKTCINHFSSFADPFYTWVLAECHFSSSLPKKQNRAHRTNSLCFQTTLAPPSSKGSFQLQILSSPIITSALFCESLFISSCIVTEVKTLKKTGKTFCLAKKSYDTFSNHLNRKTASKVCSCSLL